MKHFNKLFILEEKSNLEDYFFINLISLIISSTFAFAYIFLRIGLEDKSIFLTSKVLIVSFFIILFPLFLSGVLSLIRKKNIANFIIYEPFFLLVGLLFVVFISFISHVINLMIFVGTLGIIFLSYFLFVFIKNKLFNSKDLFIALLAIFFSLFITFSFWSSKFLLYYMSPIFYEKLFTGEALIDHIFHGAFSNMIKNYGIPSTGLNDTVYMSYHYLSHWVFARFSKLLGINALKFYEIGYPVIFLPLFFKLFFLAIKKISSGAKNLFKSWLFWLLLLTVFTGLFPKFILERFFMSNFIIISESYNMSIIIALFTFLMIAFFKESDSGSRIYLYLRYAFFIILLPLQIFLMGMTKSSTMTIFVIVFFYLFIRYGCYKKLIYNISTALTVIFAFLSLIITAQTRMETSGFELFHFFNVVIQKRNESLIWPVTLIFFIILYFFWSILFIVLENINLRNKASSLVTSFKEKLTVKMEVVIILCIAGIIPGIFLKIAGGGANYFSELQRWASIILLLAMAASGDFIKVNVDIRKITGNLRKFLVIILLIILLSGIFYNFYVEFESFYGDYSRNIAEYRSIISGSLKDDITLYRTELLKALLELDKLAISEKSNSLIYIPVDNEEFWNLKILPKTLSVPLMVPAVSGIAMIYGLPDEGLIYTKNFGYSVYRTTSKEAMDKSIEELYFEISQKGYKNLILLDYDNGEFSIDIVNENNVGEYGSYIYKLIKRLSLYCSGEDIGFDEIYDVVESLKSNKVLISDIIPEVILDEKSLVSSMDDKEFIESLYLILLDRNADENGLKHWLSEIENGKTRMDIVESFTNSNEFNNKIGDTD